MESLRAYSARAGAGGRLACLLPAACCLLLSGCQNGRQLQTDLYHRELRQQEDEIYRLEDYVEEYQSIVCSQREEIAGLKRQLATPRATATSEPSRPRLLEPEEAGPTLAPPDAKAKPLDTPSIDLDNTIDSAIKTPDLSDTPEAPPFKPSNAAPKAAPPKADALDAAPPFEGAQVDPGPATRLATLTVEEPAAEPAPFRPAEFEAPRRLHAERNEGPPNPYPTATTPALRALSEPDPEAVVDAALTLQPRSLPDGSLVAQVVGALADFSGTASLMLTDPSVEGSHKRLARWDFSKDEVAGLLASESGHLELLVAIPDTLPTDRPLRLWVRLVGDDGSRRLQAADVFFTGSPLQLAAALRRLPTPGAEQPQQQMAESNPATWRPARNRRITDGAVLRASYETEVR